MKKIVEKHSLATRWFHWINFPILSIMIYSGIMIYWANDVFSVGFGDKTILKLFPDSFYHAFHLNLHLAYGMALHFLFMWIFAINGILYVLYTVFSGEWRFLVPGKHAFKEAWQVLLHDLRISKKHPPIRKYNGAQQIAYTAIIIMGLGSLLTGIAVYKPIQFPNLCYLLGGYYTARYLHFLLTIGYVLFFVIHVLQVIKAGWNNFRAMVAGFDVEEVAIEEVKQEEIHERD